MVRSPPGKAPPTPHTADANAAEATDSMPAVQARRVQTAASSRCLPSGEFFQGASEVQLLHREQLHRSSTACARRRRAS